MHSREPAVIKVLLLGNGKQTVAKRKYAPQPTRTMTRNLNTSAFPVLTAETCKNNVVANVNAAKKLTRNSSSKAVGFPDTWFDVSNHSELKFGYNEPAGETLTLANTAPVGSCTTSDSISLMMSSKFLLNFMWKKMKG